MKEASLLAKRHLYDYQQALHLLDQGFYVLIIAAMLRADPDNLQRLRQAFPNVWLALDELRSAKGA